jgi:MFS family permease
MRERGAVLLLCLAQFVDVLGVTIAVIGLPEIGHGLGGSGAATQWVVSGYALLFGGFLVPAGRVGDRFGHRRTFLGGVAAFAVASLVAGLAPALLVVVVARSAQGLAAAFVVPSAFALVLALTEEGRERVKAVGWWTATAAAGGAAGFLCGGVLVQALGWRAMFLVNVPICVLVLLLAPRRLAGRGGDGGGPRVPLDLPGALLVTGGLLAGIAGLSGVLPSVLAPVAVLLLGAFVLVELKSANPLVPGRLVRSVRFCSALAAAFALTCATTPASVVGTVFFQTAQGLPAGLTGVLFAPFSVGVVLGSTAATRLLDRRGTRPVAAGGSGVVVTALPLGTLAVATGSTVLFTVALAGAGFGLGAASVAATNAGTEVVGDEHRGIASGLLNTAPQLGSAIGTAVIGVVALNVVPPKLTAGMLVAAGVAIAGTLAVAGLRDRVPQL